MTTVELRALGLSDLRAIEEIERRSYPTPWSRSMFAGELAKPSSICLGAFDLDGESGKLVGYLIVSRYVDAWHVMNIAVDPDHRGHGIATMVLERLFELTTEDGAIRANVVASQADLHARYGGVVPEVASRRHLELVSPVIREALAQADATFDDVDRVAVTQGPGLIGALLVGLAAAKALAWARRLPLVPVDHLDGHIASLYLQPAPLEPPFLCLLASGGHTMLVDVESHGSQRIVGTTLDDAAGEAFDKGARLLGLGYPGGRELDRLARDGHPPAADFPPPP